MSVAISLQCTHVTKMVHHLVVDGTLHAVRFALTILHNVEYQQRTPFANLDNEQSTTPACSIANLFLNSNTQEMFVKTLMPNSWKHM